MKDTKCFVSAPGSVRLGPLLGLLRQRGWSPQVLSDIAPLGTALLDAVHDAISQADWVVVVFPPGAGASNAAFEAGLAVGLGKKLVIVAAVDAEVPGDLMGVLVIRAAPDDLEAIGFGLDQLGTRPASQHSVRRGGTGHPIGAYADVLIKRAQMSPTDAEIVRLLVEAIEASGAAAVVSAGMDRGFDLGVWSDDLDAIAGNPMLIEVKRVLSPSTIRQSLTALHQSPSARLGLIVVTGIEPLKQDTFGLAFPVLAIGLFDLLARLRDESFAEIIRDLRNRSVHGPVQ